MTEEMTKNIISKDSALCNNWAGGGKCYYPNGWRNSKLTEEQEKKLPDCICKPGNTEIICDKCKPDVNLLSLFEEEKSNG